MHRHEWKLSLKAEATRIGGRTMSVSHWQSPEWHVPFWACSIVSCCASCLLHPAPHHQLQLLYKIQPTLASTLETQLTFIIDLGNGNAVVRTFCGALLDCQSNPRRIHLCQSLAADLFHCRAHLPVHPLYLAPACAASCSIVHVEGSSKTDPAVSRLPGIGFGSPSAKKVSTGNSQIGNYRYNWL